MRQFALAIAAVLATASSASAQLVYTNNFSVNNAGFGVNTATWTTPDNCMVAAYCGSYLGASGTAFGYLGGGAGQPLADAAVATLSLAGLGAHTAGVLMFRLYIIDSWDGNGETCCGPDRFQVYVNSTNLLDASFTNFQFLGTQTQSYPSPYDGGVTMNPAGTGALQNGGIGTWYWTNDAFATGGTATSVYDISIPFTDGTSSLTIDFIGNSDDQGVFDESWGLDNVSVELNGVGAVPEPGSIVLMATGLIGVAGFARRRRNAQKA